MTDRRGFLKSVVLTGGVASFLPSLAASVADGRPRNAGSAYSLDAPADNVELDRKSVV